MRINRFVGNDTYPLEIKALGWRILQAELNVGPAVLLERFGTGSWMFDDLCHTIRVALMGGGMGDQDAFKLVDLYIEKAEGQQVLLDYALIAFEVISRALTGDRGEEADEDDDLGETMTPTTETTLES